MTDVKDWILSPITNKRTSASANETIVDNDIISKGFVEMDNVRIYPGKLIFSGAYDGKKYLEKFRIINCGKVPAFVRVMQPTSSAFKMNPLPKGCIISSGLSVTRHIRYTYSSATAIPQIFISLYINEKPLLYELQVHVSESAVKMFPKMLHFGEIDVGTASEQLSLKLTNEGLKSSHFSVDLGRNDLELIVDPMKGSIQPTETVEIKVEILGSRLGNFIKEFWVKTEPPQRIWITGTFITPKLKIEHPLSNFDLIVLDFPKTYYNADSIRTLIIKNNSSTNTMFCTMANYKNEEKKLDEARKFDNNLKFFIFSPKEGRLCKNHNAAIIVKFAPRWLRAFTKKYCIAMIKILKVNYRDGVVKGKDIEVKTFSSNVDVDQFQIGSVTSVDEEFYAYEFTTSYLRICLYAEIEEARVKLTPHSIDRDDLCVGQVYNFTFNVKNCSEYLPITFKYKKIACFEMEPGEMNLKPNASVDVLLMLKPSTIGEIKSKIHLHLTYKSNDIVYKVGSAYFGVRYVCHKNVLKPNPFLQRKFNTGITPAITNEVGFLVDNARFNDVLDAPVHAFINETKKKSSYNKGNMNLVAFPNDRARTLRPWTSDTPCLTIFAKLPRVNVDEYKYSLTELNMYMKIKNKAKYDNYIRRYQEHVVNNATLSKEITLYPTSLKKVLMTNEPVKYCPHTFVESSPIPKFIPLTPEQLMEIEITPRYIQLGKIAPYISCSDFFTIQNKNEFAILLAIIALNNSVVVKGKRRIKIDPFSTRKLYFDCFSHGLGKYYVPVYIIINDSHIFDATVFAEVVPTTVKCKTKEIVINPKDNVAYAELYNPVNCAIDFSWSVHDKNYTIMPSSGTIEFRRALYCKIIFTPTIDAVFKTDIFLLSQSGAKQVITLNNENSKASVMFSTPVVEFKNIPLNMKVSENLVFRNNSGFAIVVYINENNLMKEITIHPKQAVVPGRSVIFFQVFAHFRTVETFKCSCQFIVQDEYRYKIEIIGQVNYPNFTIEPNFIQIQKIITGACQRKVFRLRNTNSSKLSIKFDLALYADYKILGMDKREVEGVELDSLEYKDLYIEFEPLEPTAFTFYVPIILNDQVGPALLNNPRSFEFKSYFDRPPSSEPADQTLIPGLRITCAAGTAWFRFSSFYLKFSNETLTNEFQLTNISNVSRNLKLFITNLDPCFSVEACACSGTIKKRENYFKIILEPEHEAIFLFKFSHECYGVYAAEIPLFVSDYFDNCPFNFIRLYACGTQPTIESNTKILCLPTIPVKLYCEKTVTLNIHSHKPDCKFTLGSEHEFLKCEFKKVKAESQDLNKKDIKVMFIPKQECNLTSKVTVSCTCEASYDLAVIASADNCSLLSYRHRMKWYSESKSLPKVIVDDFNFDMNNEIFTEKLNKLQNILEKYIYSQGFFCMSFYKIPETITRYPFEAFRRKDKRKPVKEKKKHLPIVLLFKNLCDTNILKNIIDGINYADLDDTCGTVYDYGIYKNIISLLNEYDMFSKNVKPEFLLTYSRYLVFKKELIDTENVTDDEVLSEQEFNFMSKQHWLDLLLRIYKLFHYDRVLLDKPIHSKKLTRKDPFDEQILSYYNSNKELFPPEIKEGEVKLMLWLEYHFQAKKDKLWPNKEVPFREIRDLSYDVRDSLPLITVMASYCPYLENSFKEVNVQPFTDEGQLYHNACILSESWNKLELSFTISTDEIVEPTNTEMIILLSYLYGVLPYFYPTKTITIKSDLGDTSSIHAVLKNSGYVNVSYRAILFSNENESFHLNTNTVTVEAKHTTNVKVFYTAKQIIKEEAVLVLSGETGTQKYSNSCALKLYGIPNILHCIDEFNIPVSLYELGSQVINVKSPYHQSYLANTYYYLYDPDNPPLTMKDFVSVSSVPNLPRQFHIDGICEFKDGRYKMTINLCFVTCGEYVYYLYFVNKEIGVFCIKLTIQSSIPDGILEDVRIRIPSNFDTIVPCKCKAGVRNSLCPKIIKADIPLRNLYLLNGLRKMIKIHAEEDELDFWNTHLVFPKGFHIFLKYLENSFEDVLVPFKRVLDPEVMYNAKTESSNYSPEGMIKFKSTTDEGTFQMLLHWDGSSFPEQELLILKADHGKEVRKYRLIFWTREPRSLV